MNNKIVELDEDYLRIIAEYTKANKLHPDFLPFTTYDMVQQGYPVPNEGVMVARAYGGTDGENRLLPSTGMWCKVEDVKRLLKK